LANFLIIAGDSAATSRLFQRGIDLTERLKAQKPSGVVSNEFSHVASFARRNGSGTPVVVDPATGNWLVAIGPWFHEAGYGSGQERRLLSRFTEVGAERMARELEGFFVIATGDARQREVTIVTDVVGTLHCYTRQVPGGVAISISSLVVAGLAPATLDATGCQEFLQTGAMYEERTFFREVRKLGAARCVHYRDGTLRDSRAYWQVTDLAPDSLDGAASVEAMREAVVGAARKIAAVFPRPAVDLTAGYDSRAGVAAFLSAGVKFETAVAGEPGQPDVVISDELARRTGLKHRYFQPGPVDSMDQLQQALQLTDGEYDLVDYARILQVQSDLASRFDISVNSYSGEIGRGYGWEVLRPHTGERRPLDAAKLGQRRFVNPRFDASIIAPELRIDPAAHYRDVVARVSEGLGALPNTLQYDYTMTMLRCQRWYGRIATSTNQIVACMSFFMMRSIIAPMLEANTRSRRRSLLFRRLLLELQPVLANYPLDRGYPPVPATLATLHRFWPIVPLYGSKVVGRLRRHVLPQAAAAADPPDSPRLRLWQDAALQDALLSGPLLTAPLLDGAGTRHFLERSRQPRFDLPGQWALLLSLELALRRLEAETKDLDQARPDRPGA
jgi:hypothetical protein